MIWGSGGRAGEGGVGELRWRHNNHSEMVTGQCRGGCGFSSCTRTRDPYAKHLGLQGACVREWGINATQERGGQ